MPVNDDQFSSRGEYFESLEDVPVIQGTLAEEAFGHCAAIGDLDGDGVGDLAVGATGDDDGGADRGEGLASPEPAASEPPASASEPGGHPDPLDDDGDYDHLPEAAFYMVGTIEAAVEKAQRLAAEAA